MQSLVGLNLCDPTKGDLAIDHYIHAAVNLYKTLTPRQIPTVLFPRGSLAGVPPAQRLFKIIKEQLDITAERARAMANAAGQPSR